MDIATKTIIAHDLKEYQHTHAKPAGGPAVAHSTPAKQGANTPAAPVQPVGQQATAAVTQPQAAEPKTAGATQDQKNQAYDAAIMHTISEEIVGYLHTQYTDLVEAVEDVVKLWQANIEKLKEAAPKEPGSLLSQLGSALFSVTAIVFPELAIVKAAVTVKEISEKVDKAQEPDQARAEESAAKALFASKMQAKAALEAFAKEVRTEAKNTRSSLVDRVHKAIATANKPPDFYQQVAADIEKFAGKFASETLGIKIGKDQDPGAIQKIQAKLGGEIGKWMKQQYVAEHETAAVLKETSGPMGVNAITYGAFTPEQVAERVKAYFDENPDEKKKIDEELRGEYTKEFLKKVMGEKD